MTAARARHIICRPDVAAAAHDRVARLVAERLRTAQLHPSLPPAGEVRLVGVGHSLGGMLTLFQQSRFRTFDRVAVLGWSARETNVHRSAEHFLVDDDWRVINRPLVRHLFHWDDVREEIMDADDAAVVATPRTLEDAAFVPGVTSGHAARVEVPVFVGLGERDVSPDPHGEPAMYSSSRDVTLHVLERSGHCHNFASTRMRQWDRLAAWARTPA